MAWIYADRVLDTSVTTGTGSLTVSGTSPLGWRTFSTVCVVADQFYYTIVDPITGAWETGEGTYSATNTVARTTVRASTNANALVSFAANAKSVFIDVIGYYFRNGAPAQSIMLYSSAVSFAVATTATLLVWDVVGYNSTGGTYSGGTFTVPTGMGGTWDVNLGLLMSNATSGAAGVMSLYVNSVSVASQNGAIFSSGSVQLSGKFRFAAGDNIQALTSGPTTGTTGYGSSGAERRSWMHLTRIGP
jgi:hypothetical protein